MIVCEKHGECAEANYTYDPAEGESFTIAKYPHFCLEGVND